MKLVIYTSYLHMVSIGLEQMSLASKNMPQITQVISQLINEFS